MNQEQRRQVLLRVALLAPIAILVCLSVVLQSASLLLLSAGLAVGILCTVVVFVLDRLKAPSAVVLATVLVIQLLGLHLAEAHQAEPRFRVFAQFGGTLLAVYALGLWILGIGAFGRASDRPTR